jgi:hypothetical protein
MKGKVMGRGIFVMEHARTPFQKLFLSIRQPGTAFQNLFPGIGITKTTPL